MGQHLIGIVLNNIKQCIFVCIRYIYASIYPSIFKCIKIKSLAFMLINQVSRLGTLTLKEIQNSAAPISSYYCHHYNVFIYTYIYSYSYQQNERPKPGNVLTY